MNADRHQIKEERHNRHQQDEGRLNMAIKAVKKQSLSKYTKVVIHDPDSCAIPLKQDRPLSSIRSLKRCANELNDKIKQMQWKEYAQNDEESQRILSEAQLLINGRYDLLGLTLKESEMETPSNLASLKPANLHALNN